MSLIDLLQRKGIQQPKLPPDNHDASAKDTKAAARIEEAQQEFLADTRNLLIREIQAYRSKEELIKKQLSLAFNRTHRASWSSIRPFIEQISKLGSLYPEVIVFGGWHRKHDCPKPPPSELIEDVFGLGVHCEMLRRIGAFFSFPISSQDGKRALDAVWRWEDEFPWVFQRDEETSRPVGEIRTLSEAAVATLIKQFNPSSLLLNTFCCRDLLLLLKTANKSLLTFS